MATCSTLQFIPIKFNPSTGQILAKKLNTISPMSKDVNLHDMRAPNLSTDLFKPVWILLPDNQEKIPRRRLISKIFTQNSEILCEILELDTVNLELLPGQQPDKLIAPLKSLKVKTMPDPKTDFQRFERKIFKFQCFEEKEASLSVDKFSSQIQFLQHLMANFEQDKENYTFQVALRNNDCDIEVFGDCLFGELFINGQSFNRLSHRYQDF